MPEYHVATAQERYPCIVERGILSRLASYLPERCGKIFVTTTRDVAALYGKQVARALEGRNFETLFFAGGESNKRFEDVERLAEQMVEGGADRTSIVIALGGGIVTDMGGFLAAVFMRGIPVIQVPTTLLAQVDAAIGGKTGVNLRSGKNLLGSFHQPLAVLVDPDVIYSLPAREYRAGLFEVIKYGVIASPELFALLRDCPAQVLAKDPALLEKIIAESVRIKAEVVSADEKESDLRRILNFGHTIGHALEAETQYSRFLHGEAVGFGMNAATRLACALGLLSEQDEQQVLSLIECYGPLPNFQGIKAENLVGRLVRDKKTIQGKVHFVLPDRIGHVVVRSGLLEPDIMAATRAALR
ncbi:MAG TPA: 3-dehydroquinate synthase [Bryobacteraceae bacterium]|nr:3-dehydroquinate synthase [Bryobacteraceae bacterium]